MQVNMVPILKKWVRNVWIAGQLLLRMIALPVAVLALVADLSGFHGATIAPLLATLIPLALLLIHAGFRSVIDLGKAIGLLYVEGVALSERAVLSLEMLRRNSYATAPVGMLAYMMRAVRFLWNGDRDVLAFSCLNILLYALYAVLISEWIIYPILARNDLAVLRGRKKNLEHSRD
jgi:hypothetical protein